MTGIQLTEQVKDFVLKEIKADLVGIAPIERFEQAPPGYKPQDILPVAKSVIVFAFDSLESTMVSNCPRTYQLRYTGLRERCQTVGYDLGRFLERRGYYGVHMPSTAPLDIGPEKRGVFGDFSYRHAAVAAGLGELGWNQILLTPQFGPRVWLMAVITNAELRPDPVYHGPKLCLEDKCRKCVDNCPQNALSPGVPTDKRKCVRSEGEYGLYGLLKHLKNIAEEPDPEKRKDLILGPATWALWMALQFGGGPSHCNACVKFCPVGLRVPTR